MRKELEAEEAAREEPSIKLKSAIYALHKSEDERAKLQERKSELYEDARSLRATALRAIVSKTAS